MRVLELYSGIGGMHYALKASGISHNVVAAADVNTVANDVYSHNFPETRIITRGIESLTVEELDTLAPELIHMSPPCQPFVRVGKQKDAGDARTKSFLHLISLFPRLRQMPRYLLVENVRGFECSDTRSRLLEMLNDSGYRTQEFMLSPLQCGIPNSRLRYYLLAKRRPLDFHFTTTAKIADEFPGCKDDYLFDNGTPRDLLNGAECITQVGKADSNTVKTDMSGDEREICRGDAEAEGQAKATATCHDSTQDVPTPSSVQSSALQNNQTIVKCTTMPAHRSGTKRVAEEFEMGDGTALDAPSSSGTRETDFSHSTCCACVEQPCRCHSAANANADSKAVQSGDGEEPLYTRCRSICLPLSRFLETEKDSSYFSDFSIPDKFLKRFWSMDIVKAHARNACCFTKRYGHHIEGAGSVIQMNTESSADLTQYKKDGVLTPEVADGVRSLQLRFFTPREIANLLCFPSEFDFPASLSTKQCYRLLGNSLNVHVVAVLLRLLVRGDDPENIQKPAPETAAATDS